MPTNFPTTSAGGLPRPLFTGGGDGHGVDGVEESEVVLPEEELDLLLKLRSLWRGLTIFNFGLAPRAGGGGGIG